LAAAQGAITPDEAFKLSQMVDTFVRFGNLMVDHF
jgi:hypothetical protein